MWTFLVWSDSGQVSRPVSGVSGHAAAVDSPAEGALEEWEAFRRAGFDLGHHSCTLAPHPTPVWFWPPT